MRITLPKPSAGLLGKIMQRIEHERCLQIMRWKAALFGLLSALSLASLAPALSAFKSDLAQSGFAEFLSLAVLDTGTVLASWQNFGLALLESLPAISIIGLLAVTLMLLLSLKFLSQNTKSLFAS